MESGIVPSYLTKLGRAERALSELQTEVERFANANGFAVERVVVRNPGANNEYLLRRAT